MTHPELEAEQRHVDRAYARLEVLRDAARESSAVVAGRALTGSGQSLLERDALFYARRDRFVALTIGDEPLVFGRIDTRDQETFHIGRVGILDEDRTSLVVDWRAPAASAFYRATPGDPGDVVRRRHIHCRAQRVLSIDDELLDASEGAASGLTLVGEAALLRAVGRTRTGRMRDIVSTIQVEQDRVIRAPLTDVLVVQGGPGTGKTAVGLHRAAYLLYTHRNKLERSGVLLIGPDPVFLRYVEQVLPSLGESAARLATTGELFDGVTANRRDRPDVARVKGDTRMVRVIRRAAQQRQRPLDHAIRVLYDGEVLELTPKATRRIVERVTKMRGTHNQRRRSLIMGVLMHLLELYRSEAEQSFKAGTRGPAPWGTKISKDEQTEFFEDMLDDERVRTAIDEMWPVLGPQRLLRELYSSDEMLRASCSGILRDRDRDLLRREPDERWTTDDVPLLDEARVLLGPEVQQQAEKAPKLDEEERWMVERMLDDLGTVDPIIAAERSWLSERYLEQRADLDRGDRAARVRTTYGHVIVDEAQDLSPMQWRLIARRVPSRSVTVLGDLAQATGAWTPDDWPDALAELKPRKPPTVAELTINYRTPGAIMDVANRVIEGIASSTTRPTSVREGDPPSYVAVAPDELVAAAAKAAIAERDATDGTVAVIAPARHVEDIARELGPRTGSTGDLDADIVVLPARRAKGLEFDAVVVVEPAAIERASGPRALYVTLTRPTQRLVVVHAEPLPPALA